MGPNNTVFYQYGWNDDRSAIIVTDRDTLLRINQGDNNLFVRQRQFQDTIMSSVREHAGIPTGLSSAWRAADNLIAGGLITWATGADDNLPKTILTNISKMTDIPADKTGLGRQFTSREVMLALHDISEHLPAGMKSMLERVGAGTPAFRDALNGALKNENFRNYILSDAGAEAFSKSLATLSDADFLEKMKTKFGLDDAKLNTIIDKVGTDILTRIGNGEFDGKMETLSGAINTSIASTVVTEKLDALVAEKPELATIVGHIKGDPALMRSIANAYLEDPTVGPGLEAMLKGEGGLDITKLNALFETPGARATLASALDAVAAKPDLDFSFLKRVAETAANGDMPGAIEQLRKIPEIKIDPSLAQAADMGSFMQKLQVGLKDFIAKNPWMGKIMEFLGGIVEKLFGADNEISKFFKSVMPTGVTLADTRPVNGEFRRTAAGDLITDVDPRTRTPGYTPGYIVG